VDIDPLKFFACLALLTVAAVMSAFYISPADASVLQTASLIAGIGVSFQVVYSLVGQLSLGHSALFGVGAYAYAYLTSKGVAAPVAVLAACLFGTIAGFLMAAATARLRGVYFAVVTFAMANILMVVASTSPFFGSSDGISGVPSLYGFAFRSVSQTFYCVLAFAIVMAGFYCLWRSRLGKMLEAVRANPGLAAALGINVTTAIIVATSISGLLASFIGAIAAQQTRFVGPDVFGLYYIITPLAAVVIGGSRSVAGSAAGTLIVFVVPVVLSINPVLNQVVSGLLLTLFAIFFPAGITGVFRRWRRPSGSLALVDDRPEHEFSRTPNGDARRGEPVLLAEKINLSYGGVRAVADMSISLVRGEVVGLIGTNGAGKSSLVNAVTGHSSLAKGGVMLGAANLAGLAPHLRARAGLARTFQDNAVIETLTVYQSVALAMSKGLLFGGAPGGSSEIDQTIAVCGLSRVTDRKVGEWTYLHRRMTAIAMAMAMRPSVLFLDEATAGLTGEERARIGGLVTRLASETCLTVLVIEHDVEFVASIADRIVVMERGGLLCEGPARTVLHDPNVVASYLGNEWNAAQTVEL
jgi:ABC-type branched-subunit amino acid transport system ATPase component/ABC-type branched-subunit amino acid transport system permease subunit